MAIRVRAREGRVASKSDAAPAKEGLICSINTYLHDVPMMDGFFPKSGGH